MLCKPLRPNQLLHRGLRHALLSLCLIGYSLPCHAEEGITENEIRIGGVMDLSGQAKELGNAIKLGIDAAFNGQYIDGKKLVFIARDDQNTPEKAFKVTQHLIEEQVFAFMGNMGTSTAKLTLPLLESYGIPAIGFVSGADLLRHNQSTIINLRASYDQEIATIVQYVIKNAFKASDICAFVQNDDEGLGAIRAIISALEQVPDSQAQRLALQQVLNQTNAEARNNIGPVGLYTRNTYVARDGYLSLKAWEAQHQACQFIITTGTYASIARFIAYSKQQGETWLYSAVSSTSADAFYKTLERFQATQGVVITQVMPTLNSPLELVQQARHDLGEEMGFASLEGYAVGNLLIYALRQLQAQSLPLTRKNLLDALHNQRFSLQGLALDFSHGNQGMNEVTLTKLNGTQWESIPTLPPQTSHESLPAQQER